MAILLYLFHYCVVLTDKLMFYCTCVQTEACLSGVYAMSHKDIDQVDNKKKIKHVTRMHSSRMRTARWLTIVGGRVCVGRWLWGGGKKMQKKNWGGMSWGGTSLGGACLGGCTCPGGEGVSCDLSHHAFDVTCMLPLHQLSVSTCAAPYIVWPRCMLGYHPTPPPPVNRMTNRCKNITLPQASFAGGKK